jgi:hypothetical protein
VRIPPVASAGITTAGAAGVGGVAEGAPAGATDSLAAAAPGTPGTLGPPEVPLTRPPRAASAVASLARREAGLLLRHPGFGVGLVLSLVGYWVAASGERGTAVVLPFSSSLALAPLLLAWAGLVAVNLGALRARRDRTGELFDSVPLPPVARTAAHLASVLVLAPVVVILAVASYRYWKAQPGAVGSMGLPHLAQLLLIVLGAGVSGVLVARWAPTAAGGPLAVIAIIVLQINFGYQDARWRWLHFASGDAYATPFDIRHDGWHLVWLVGLVLLGVMLALARHGLTRQVVAAAAVALALLAVSGWAQTRPPDPTLVAARVDELVRPAAHQVCAPRAGATYCAYPAYRRWITLWAAPVHGVLSVVPAEGRTRPLVVRQRALPTDFHDLLPEVAAGLDPAAVWRADGIVHPGLGWKLDDHQLTLGFQTAAWAVGLPAAVAWPGEACTAGGQARVVTALWLAGQSTPTAGRVLRSRAAAAGTGPGGGGLSGLAPVDALPDYNNSDRPYVPEVGAAGRGADLVSAVALLDRPPGQVASVLRSNWARLTDPATPARVLLDLAGAPVPAGAADLVPATPGVGRSCP